MGGSLTEADKNRAGGAPLKNTRILNKGGGLHHIAFVRQWFGPADESTNIRIAN